MEIKYCLKGSELTNKIKHLQKDKTDRCRLKKDYEEFIKDNKFSLKYSKGGKVKDIKFLLKKLIRLL